MNTAPATACAHDETTHNIIRELPFGRLENPEVPLWHVTLPLAGEPCDD